MRTATPDAYFDRFWATGDDPWAHASRWSELRKYGITLAALPRPHYLHSFEPGCGAGVLTALLAERSDHHLAMERDARGAAATRVRCEGLGQVEVRRGRIPQDWPDDRFDLIVLSEVLYYLSGPELDQVLGQVARSLAPEGDLVVVHHRPVVEEHTWTGDEVHDRLRRSLDWTPLGRTVEPGFVVDVLRP